MEKTSLQLDPKGLENGTLVEQEGNGDETGNCEQTPQNKLTSVSGKCVSGAETSIDSQRLTGAKGTWKK